MKKIGLLIGLATLLFVACETEKIEPEQEQQAEQKWTIEVVDSIVGSNVGAFNILSYDVDSGVHIAYIVSVGTINNLKYAYKPYLGDWTTTEVASDLNSVEIDITVDKQKNVFIAYESGNDESLYIAEKSITGSFNHVLVDVLDDRNYQARYPALCVDNNDRVHLSFERANYGQRYTSYTFQGAFTNVEVMNDTYGGSLPDIVVDSKGNKHILYHGSGFILHSFSENNTNTWTVNEVASYDDSYQSYEGISLAIDQNDGLHGAYKTGSSDNNIKYVYKADGSDTWANEGIGNIGGSNRIDRAIACDINNTPRVLFDQDFGLNMATKDGNWEHELIKGNSDYRCDSNYDLEITDKNRAHVSFHCRTTEVLLYATQILE